MADFLGIRRHYTEERVGNTAQEVVENAWSDFPTFGSWMRGEMMTDPTILFVKPKAISTRDKKALQAAGVIVVEVDDVANVKLVRAHAELEGGALLRAAAEAITKAGYSTGDARTLFAKAVCAAIEAQADPGKKDRDNRESRSLTPPLVEGGT